MLLTSWLTLGLAVPSVLAQKPGSFIVAGDTLVSAMMVCCKFTFLNLLLIKLRCL